MERKSINYQLIIATIGAITLLPSAMASTLMTYELGAVHAGAGAATPDAWIRAIFSAFADDKVLLRIEATDFMSPGQFITKIGFNHDLGSSVTVLPCDTALCGGMVYGTAPLPNSMAEGSIPPGGTFSIVFSFPQSSGPHRFQAEEYGNYLLTGAGLTVESFDAYSEPTGNNPPFKSYAHLQGQGGNAKIYDNAPEYDSADNEYAGANVPEPGVTLLIGSGLLGFGLLARRLRRT
jgi:hypothetical protein